jgi:hypothetical protein
MHHAMTKRGSTCTDQLDFVNARMQIGTQVDLTWIPDGGGNESLIFAWKG